MTISSISKETLQIISCNETVKIKQSDNSPTVHHVQGDHERIKAQASSSSSAPYQCQIIASSFHTNTDKFPAIVGQHGETRYSKSSPKVDSIRDYTLWSLFTMFFCGFLIGAFAIQMSCATINKKSKGDLIGAQNASKLAATLNITATISGALLITVLTLHFTGRVSA